MPELESPNAGDEDADGSGETVELPDGAGGGTLRLPPTASADEAAAVAAAIGAHLSDRRRARRAGAASDGEDGPGRQDDWILAARLGREGTDPWHDTAVGEEWRASARKRRR